MPSVEQLSVSAVRAAMAPGFQIDEVAVLLCTQARDNVTVLRLARARIERGAGWRAGPIGQRARDALTRAIELSEPEPSPMQSIDLTDHTIDLTEAADRPLPA